VNSAQCIVQSEQRRAVDSTYSLPAIHYPLFLAALAAQDPQIAAVFKRPFDEQVAFFRGKLGNLVPTQTWRDLQGAAQDRGFMVAGAAKADLLADLAGAIDKAGAEGETLDAFRRRFRDIVSKHGWHGWTGEGTKAGEAWRTRAIYQTNLQTSYAAGRLAQLERGDYPLWLYKHSPASKEPRLDHLSWDGLVLPPDHAFWEQHSPPNGFGCKCRVVGVRSPAQAQRLGGNPDKSPPRGWDEIDPATGAQTGIGEGWGYKPGGTVLDTVRSLSRKLDLLPAQPSVALIQEWLRTASFADWFANPREAWPLVRLPDDDVKALGAQTSIASLSAETVAKQKREHPELPPREYLAAQRVVDEPTAKAQQGISMLYIKEEVTDETGGHVLVVRATQSGNTIFVRSYRRLSRQQALRDAEIQRLLRRGRN